MMTTLLMNQKSDRDGLFTERHFVVVVLKNCLFLSKSCSLTHGQYFVFLRQGNMVCWLSFSKIELSGT